MNKNIHLNADARKIIEDLLNHRMNYAGIAHVLGKDPTTISKEIKLHIVCLRTGVLHGKKYNNCKHQFSCKISAVCVPCGSPQKFTFCRNCINCNKHCPEFTPIICKHRFSSSQLCNGCRSITSCNFEKRLYKADLAQQQYKTLLSEARSGIRFSEEELQELDDKISPLIRQGQSPHHIYINNQDSLMTSEATIYRLIDSCLINARNIDLPRKVRFKPRKKKRTVFKVDPSCRVGRDYDSFKHFIEQNPDMPITEIDSVLGKTGGKVLLTIHFINCETMFAFLRDHNDAKSVIHVFDSLYQTLGHIHFCNLFKLCLTDNGSEFSDPIHIEFSPDGVQRTRVFYCEPQAPYQKGSVERNHHFIRDFIPKGSDLAKYTQDDISLMINHINSYSRPSLGDKCPYDVFRFLYGNEIFELLGCAIIPAQQVTLNNSIFRKVTME